jgi:hypothetical protein
MSARVVPDEILRLVEFRPTPFAQRWTVGAGDRNQGRTGLQIGTLGFKRHHGEPAVVLRMDDTSRAESFSPMQLFPAIPSSSERQL